MGKKEGGALPGDFDRELHVAACAGELTAAGCRDHVHAAYERFLAINHGFLTVCTDWQLRGGPQELNDHSDSAYDASVIARLVAIDVDVQPIVADVAAHLARFGAYGSRLASARKRVESGERDWFTGAMIESYHTVWFELHEDLLSTLGIERSKEGT